MNARVRSLSLLTSSSSKAFRSCPRAYRHRYVDELVSAHDDRGPRAFGTLVHLALEAWWTTIGTDPEGALERALGALPALTDREDPFERARLVEMLRLYDARWLDESQTYEVIQAEGEYRAPLINPDTGSASRTFQRAGKIDVLVREKHTGRAGIIEHKTSSEDISPGSDYWARLTLDGQISHYYAGAAAMGVDADFCIYDVLGKPSQRPKLATPAAERKYTQPTKKDPEPRLYANQRDRDETVEEYAARVRESLLSDPDRYVRRAEIVRLEEDLREAAFDDWQIARAIRESENAGRWPRNTDACKRFGSTCTYFGLCTRTASADDASLFKRERPHRELTEPTMPAEPAAAE